MSSSYNAEMELRKIADELFAQAGELQEAADVLKTLREDNTKRISEAKKWAKDWMKRDS